MVLVSPITPVQLRIMVLVSPVRAVSPFSFLPLTNQWDQCISGSKRSSGLSHSGTAAGSTSEKGIPSPAILLMVCAWSVGVCGNSEPGGEQTVAEAALLSSSVRSLELRV
ncbi:hypothetical protein PAMP_006169 [Pampus punctatissimus]